MPTTTRPAPGADTIRIAQNIRMHLGRLRMSRAELASKMTDAGFPISAPQLNRYANGERAMSTDELRPIADALGITVAALMDGVV